MTFRSLFWLRIVPITAWRGSTSHLMSAARFTAAQGSGSSHCNESSALQHGLLPSQMAHHQLVHSLFRYSYRSHNASNAAQGS